jgi:hypothetical protein
MDVAKVDRDIAYVIMVVDVYCKLLFPMFYQFFRRMLQVYLYMFYTYVGSVLFSCYVCFTMVSSVF